MLDRVGLFDENLAVGEDSDLWWRVAAATQIGYVDQVVATVRASPDGLSRKGSRVSWGWVGRSRKALCAFENLTGRQRRLLQLRLYEDWRNYAFDLGEEGRNREMRAACLSAARVALAAGLWTSTVKSVAAAVYGHGGQKWIRGLRGRQQ